MTKYLIDEELMASIADATKEKKSLDTIEAEDIPEAIASISSDPVLETLSVTENGTYTPTTGVDGYDEVVVNVPTPDTLRTFLEGPGTIEYNSSTLTNLSYAMFLAYVDAPQSSGFGTKIHNHITKISTPNLNKIYGFACTGQDNLTEITVGNNCNIDAAGRAFSYCSSLSKINGHMVLNFGNRPDHMFAYCSAIRWNSADWSGLKVLPDSFFAYSGIDEFDFANLEGFHDSKQFQGCTNLKKIYYRHFYAFSNNMFADCTSLEDFYIQYTGGKIGMGAGSFNNVPNTMRLHVPASLLSDYQADGNWNRFELIGDAEPLE